MAIEYTVEECETAIRQIDARILTLLNLPAQSGADGVYASFAGRVAEAQRERETWTRRLALAQRRESGQGNGGLVQGPSFEVW